MPKSSASHTEVSLTDVSPTDLPDAAISRAVIRAIRSQIIAPAAYGEPANIGSLAATLTTSKSSGDTITVYLSNSSGICDFYIDCGDGNPEHFYRDESLYVDRVLTITLKGSAVKIYGDLRHLSCQDNNLTALDVSMNGNLEWLDCSSNELKSLDLSNNPALYDLCCSRNQLTSLVVSNNPLLRELRCDDNPLGQLDVTHNPVLSTMNCWRTQLTSLNVTNNPELYSLQCHQNALTSLNVRSNPKLDSLRCYENPIKTIDVTQNLALTDLYCANNELTSLDVTNNTALKTLYCYVNELTSLDLSHNTNLVELVCGANALSELDVSHNTALTRLECYSNHLTSLDLTNNVNLTTLDCTFNSIPFSGFKGMRTANYDQNSRYVWQTPFEIPSAIMPGDSIDLSSQNNVEGTPTVFQWYCDEEEVTPTASENGVFTFGEEFDGKTLVCKMTNARLPDFKEDYLNPFDGDVFAQDARYSTVAVTVGEAAPVDPDPIDPENLGDPVITMTTSLPVGHVIPEYSSWDNDVFEVWGGYTFIDYGDGNIVSCPGDRTVRGSVIKIYGQVNGLVCWRCELNTLDVSKCSDLDFLDCSHNNLTSLDVSQNANLENLQCYNNQLTKLDVSKNADLLYLSCHYNPLKTIDVSKNANLEELGCGGTQITSLDVSKNTKLTALWCYDNQLTTLDLTHNPDLTIINCGDNQLTSLDVTKQSALEDLYFDSNRITSIDLSKNIALNILACNNNLLTTLDISNNTNLAYLHSHNNYLTFATINNCNPDNIDSMEYCEYAPQTHRLPASVKAGETVDLSGEYTAGGTVSQFTWYDADGNVVKPATAKDGKFTFGEDAVGKTLICKMTNAKLPLFDEKAEVIVDWNNETDSPIFETRDNRLVTTKIKILAADSTEPTDPEEEETEDNNGNGKVTPYYDLPFEQNEDIDDVTAVKYPEGTVVDVDGRVRNLHSLRGIQLTVGNIETNKKKSVLDAIKHYNESFDTDTTDIALYDITLEDNNKVHVKLVGSELLICLKYPDNLARQSEDYVFHLYHQKDDGTIEEIPITLRPNGIWFRAKEFSPYALYWHVKSAESVGTGESTAMIIVMTSLLAMSLAGAGFVLYRRRKQTAA